MDFGRVEKKELNGIEFLLPKEPSWNKNILPGKKVNPKVNIGLDKWVCKEWIGKLYPKGTNDAVLLDEYAKHYNSIELNATHYKLYKPDEIEKWKQKVRRASFVFCPKTYQGITHFGNLKDKQFLTDVFFDTLKPFGNNLGAILFQVSDKFGPKRKDELFDYLQTLPKDNSFFLEVRHPGWYKEPVFNELLLTLKELFIGLCITDSAGRRDCSHMYLTIPKAFIRYVSNDGHETDYKRLHDWVQRIGLWIDQGLEELNFFIHGDANSPEMSKYLIEQLNKYCSLHLKEIRLISNL
jgi:uncharacterized protein YecE (DUF72 family)